MEDDLSSIYQITDDFDLPFGDDEEAFTAFALSDDFNTRLVSSLDKAFR